MFAESADKKGGALRALRDTPRFDRLAMLTGLANGLLQNPHLRTRNRHNLFLSRNVHSRGVENSTTQTDTAATMNVSRESVISARKAIDDATPEIIAAVDAVRLGARGDAEEQGRDWGW